MFGSAQPTRRRSSRSGDRAHWNSSIGDSLKVFFKRLKLLFYLVLALMVVSLLGIIILVSAISPLSAFKTLLLVPTDQTQPFQLVVMWPSDQSVAVYSLNPELTLPLAGGYGQRKIHEVPQLLRQNGHSYDYTRGVYAQSLGLVVDEILEVPSLTAIQDGSELEKVFWDVLWQGRTYSHVSLLELTRTYVFTRQVEPKRIKVIPVATWADWPVALSKAPLAGLYTECPIAVVNTTPKSGLASQVARVLEQSGFVVVRLTTEMVDYPQSQVLIDGEHQVTETQAKCVTVAEKLLHFLPDQEAVTNTTSKPQQYRAGVVLMIGDDLPTFLPTQEQSE